MGNELLECSAELHVHVDKTRSGRIDVQRKLAPRPIRKKKRCISREWDQPMTYDLLLDIHTIFSGYNDHHYRIACNRSSIASSRWNNICMKLRQWWLLYAVEVLEQMFSIQRRHIIAQTDGRIINNHAHTGVLKTKQQRIKMEEGRASFFQFQENYPCAVEWSLLQS